MNPLKAAYKNGGSAPAPTSPSAPPATIAPVSAPIQTTQIPAAAGGTRDLSALRAKLSGGFVNPPETGEAINEDTLAPRTVETPDGGATAAPGYVELKGGLVVKAPAAAPTAEPAPSGSTPASTAELSRGQKAAATRAANKAAKTQPAESAAAPEGSGWSVAPPAASSVAYSLKDVSTDDLLAEIYKRVAARFA